MIVKHNSIVLVLHGQRAEYGQVWRGPDTATSDGLTQLWPFMSLQPEMEKSRILAFGLVSF